jgi:uncharacterized protein YecA (UPF0149 family)
MEDTEAKELKTLRSGVTRQYKKLLSVMEDWLETDESDEGQEIYESLIELYEQLEANLESLE